MNHTMTSIQRLCVLVALSQSNVTYAQLTVLTTTTDLRSIVAEVGGDHVNADSIAKGTQDPHFVEAKPSFMLKANRADLLVSVGLDLESGWLPSVIQGARNPKINPGQNGNLAIGPLVQPLEVPIRDVTRADGDVHPMGNPHVLLDPVRAGEIAVRIAERLSELDPTHAAEFNSRAQGLQARLAEKSKAWKTRISQTAIKRVVTYHKTLNYFLNAFGIQVSAVLEPKPGIPPTSGHIISVIRTIREHGVRLILVENYFDATVTRKIQQEIPGVRATSVAVSVEGTAAIKSIDDLYEHLVRAFEGA